MKVLGKANENEQIFEQGEEKLGMVCDFKNAPGVSKTVLAAIDGGSTQTRGIMMDVADLVNYEEYLEDVFVIPSMSSVVLDAREIDLKSNILYDNLDSTIINQDNDGVPLIAKSRVVRGSVAMNVEMTENRLGSSTQKTSDPTFYYNLLDELGYLALYRFKDAVPEKLDIYLAVSLPPDDRNKKNDENFRANMRSYRWVHNPSGVKIDFNFVAIHAMTEPEADVKGYYAVNELRTPMYTLHLNGGGRSIGAEVLVNGKSLKTAQKTLTFGGTQLLELVAELYVEEYGGSKPRRAALEEAIRSGNMRYGNGVREVVSIIAKAKAEFANRIVTETRREVFDVQTRVALVDLNVISFSGRMFDAGDYNISVAEYAGKKFKELTPETDLLMIGQNYIPQGLFIDGVIEFFESQLRLALEAAAIEEEAAATSEGSSL